MLRFEEEFSKILLARFACLVFSERLLRGIRGGWKHLVQNWTLCARKLFRYRVLDKVFSVVVAMIVTRYVLVSIRRVAMRKHVWFSVLGRVERAIVNLTIRCVEEIRSVKLAMIVKAIVDKLNEAVKSRVERLMVTAGSSLARTIAGIAVSWGNLEAVEWASDRGFIRYVTVMEMNRSFSRF